MADKLSRAEKAIEANLYDLEAWGQILREAQLRKIDDARVHFERLITEFPTSGRYWKMYIEQEMRARNYDRVEKVLNHVSPDFHWFCQFSTQFNFSYIML